MSVVSSVRVEGPAERAHARLAKLIGAELPRARCAACAALEKQAG